MKDKKEPEANAAKKVEEKKYVLIIDEINRANIPSVLGELIYALEYRGEKVESIYALDGDNALVIPPNLYIIGTMNTADRSVGHMDYAIRRRFSFVDVLPDAEIIENAKAKTLFNQVSDLFEEKYLSSEFEKKQIQLGHSYFLVANDEQLEIQLEYEIKPILLEYVNDGILKVEARPVIENLKVG
jgi:5-methylcytosine-specific restriction endonuclease McrBC GTP-binding regulatory subunit McrB